MSAVLVVCSYMSCLDHVCDAIVCNWQMCDCFWRAGALCVWCVACCARVSPQAQGASNSLDPNRCWVVPHLPKEHPPSMISNLHHWRLVRVYESLCIQHRCKPVLMLLEHFM